MRLKQLISVDHLPTIFETYDEAYHDSLYSKDAGLSNGCNPSQTQDDYLKSIRQLAQPTFLFDTSSKTENSSYTNNSLKSPKQTVSRRHQAEPPSTVSLLRSGKKGNCPSALADAFPLDTITVAVDNQHYSQTLGNNTDPFSWLFGQSQKTNHRRSNQQFPRQHALTIYTNEANCSTRSHWLSLDHTIMAKNEPHEKPSLPHTKASSMGRSANIIKGKLASSERFLYDRCGNK
ncbi:protein DEPP-like [Heterodontus francisci]|uniref:protein DEPP-like n=1 Tax=Heterodontus francisci TaxID=7792 RepID=UPI00355BEB62